MDYDMIVIGAGPAGYVCAIRASQLGQRVAIVEKEWLGGVCLNVGCIPSKSLLRNAEVAELLRHGGKDFGFKMDNLQLDFAAAVQRSRQISRRLVKGVEFLLKKNKIDVLSGTAELTSASVVRVTGADGATRSFSAASIVVATGAHVFVPAAFKTDGKRVFTYLEAILQETRPERVVIIGGGAIGVEFATIWNAYGTHVTVVEKLPRLLPREDEEVSTELAKAFKRQGIEVRTGASLENLDTSAAQVRVTISTGTATETLEADQVMLAMGFAPNTKGLGLEALGVQLGRGFVQVDAGMRTNVPGVYAIGDVTGELLLAHVGSAQGIVCAETIGAHPTVTLDYKMMPRATYCHPEVASFGHTEAEVRAAGHELKVARFNFQANGKALGLNEGSGWAKLITSAGTGEILGAHLIGPQVTELLPELTLAANAELTIEEIARNVHAHPSLSEVLMEAAHGLAGGYIHA
jgi:dihydrolipoamide dehydrogenase